MKTTTRRNLERNMAKVLAEHDLSGVPLLILSPGNKHPMIVISQRKYDELASK